MRERYGAMGSGPPIAPSSRFAPVLASKLRFMYRNDNWHWEWDQAGTSGRKGELGKQAGGGVVAVVQGMSALEATPQRCRVRIQVN